MTLHKSNTEKKNPCGLKQRIVTEKIINREREELQKDHVIGSNSVEVYLKQKICRNSPRSSGSNSVLSLLWAQVQSLVGELRPHTPRGSEAPTQVLSPCATAGASVHHNEDLECHK